MLNQEFKRRRYLQFEPTRKHNYTIIFAECLNERKITKNVEEHIQNLISFAPIISKKKNEM